MEIGKSGRVEEGVASLLSHKSGRARLRHPARQVTVLLRTAALRKKPTVKENGGKEERGKEERKEERREEEREEERGSGVDQVGPLRVQRRGRSEDPRPSASEVSCRHASSPDSTPGRCCAGGAGSTWVSARLTYSTPSYERKAGRKGCLSYADGLLPAL